MKVSPGGSTVVEPLHGSTLLGFAFLAELLQGLVK
jgi:hypothetical protein